MDKEFITLGEAARLLRQTDLAIMRMIKEALQTGFAMEDIMKKEQRGDRMMFLVSKDFLQGELEKPQAPGEAAEPGNADEEETTENSSPPSLGGVVVAKDEMIATLQKIIDKKDQQIEDLSGKIDQLIERDHETNVLLKGLHDRLFLLEQKNPQSPRESKKKK